MLIGDSIADQTAPYLAPLLGGRHLVDSYFGGTAPCDWVTKHPPISHGSTVVISFIGNSFTPCMSDGAGGHLEGEAISKRYRVAVATLIDQSVAAHARVVLVGQPAHIDPHDRFNTVRALNAIYQSMATRPDVTYVDAGATVENPDGSFAHALPCLANEVSCGPSGTNVVRNDDGVHFCPGAPERGPCAHYSSGAFRFANAIAHAVPGV